MRNRDTSAAIAANIKRKHERWIKELIEAGYFVQKTGNREVAAPGMRLYATNGFWETYEVIDWERAIDAPVLRGRDGAFLGTQSYVFTVGPR